MLGYLFWTQLGNGSEFTCCLIFCCLLFSYLLFIRGAAHELTRMSTIAEKMALNPYWSQAMEIWHFKGEKQASHNYSIRGLRIMFVVQGIFSVLKMALHFSLPRIHEGLPNFHLGLRFCFCFSQKVIDVFELLWFLQMENTFEVRWIRLRQPQPFLGLSLFPLHWQNSYLKQLMVNSLGLCSCQN